MSGTTDPTLAEGQTWPGSAYISAGGVLPPQQERRWGRSLYDGDGAGPCMMEGERQILSNHN